MYACSLSAERHARLPCWVDVLASDGVWSIYTRKWREQKWTLQC